MLNITCHVLVCVWKRYEWAKSALCEATVNEKEKKKSVWHVSWECRDHSYTSATTLPVLLHCRVWPTLFFSDGPLFERLTSDLGGPCCRLCSEQTHQLPEGKKKPAAGQYQRWRVVSKMCLSPLCWSSRCSTRTWETPALLCPTSGSGCSSPRFPPRCSRWWATCGPPHSSDLTETEPLRF